MRYKCEMHISRLIRFKIGVCDWLTQRLLVIGNYSSHRAIHVKSVAETTTISEDTFLEFFIRKLFEDRAHSKRVTLNRCLSRQPKITGRGICLVLTRVSSVYWAKWSSKALDAYPALVIGPPTALRIASMLREKLAFFPLDDFVGHGRYYFGYATCAPSLISKPALPPCIRDGRQFSVLITGWVKGSDAVLVSLAVNLTDPFGGFFGTVYRDLDCLQLLVIASALAKG